MDYEAVEIKVFGQSSGVKVFAVRPRGQMGTCGWYPEPWTVSYQRARTAEEAIAKVRFADACMEI